MNQAKYLNQNKFVKIDRIEPKRSFVISQLIRNLNKGNRRYLPKLSNSEFENRLQKAKNITLNLSEKELDKRIEADSPKYKRRLRFYNSVNWYEGLVTADEVGVWKGAGGIPIEWTQGSLAETASIVHKAIEDEGNNKVAARAKRAIPRILENINVIEKDKYLYPIILPPATNGRGLYGKPYKHFKLMKGDVDDGCMRSIALVISGRLDISTYIGIGD